MKNFLPVCWLVLLALAGCSPARAQSGTLTTPEQFLGYPVGSRFTPHHRVLAYAELMARQRPNQVKLLPYGTTYEGRQLMAVVVASEANMARLDDIRTTNLKRTGLLDGAPATGSNSPAIAWLSYNVHGNEAVSSEAFLEVLHELLSPKPGSVAPNVLANTVVILDPDLNPDGHDRYVNWYNQMVGRNPDPTPFAREHNEPWPGGRYTHYYFDPNRDWAWQTQEITQQRMALYHQWMPHVHGDFHEMGVESPYYFAPSAKPYHEDITPYQRRFQDIIGRYNARYFDKNGWLYYTRERFDLFYPSYGDTWPTYNGAIGMTFEQGGSGRAGLAIRKQDGDTLTLRERIDHHVTASYATLESVADNAADIVREFGSFFERARTSPIGAYKTYVVKAAGDPGRMQAFRQLLDRNRIQYGVAGKAQTVGGYNYFSQRNEKSVAVAPEDLVISAYQPKSTLLKILFEPKSTLEDSATYDITAWSIPYAFGLPTYGLTTRLNPAPYPTSTPNAARPTDARRSDARRSDALPGEARRSDARPYAYVVRWQSLPSVQLLAGLLKAKVRVRAAEKPFELDNQTYPAGTLLITRAGNERLGDRFDALVAQEAAKAGITATPVATGFVTKGSDFGSDFVLALKAPRVGVVVGDGTYATTAGEVWHYFDQELNYPATLIDANALGSVDWKQLDVLVLPGGNGYGRILSDKNLSAIREWVRAGGKLIALEGATAALAGKPDFELKEKEDPKKDKDTAKGSAIDSLKIYGDRERTALSDETPGSIYRVNLDTTHPLAFGLGDTYYSLVQNAANYEVLKDGWNVGYLKSDNYVAGFAGRNARAKLRNTLVMGVQDLGRGNVVYLADNPLFRGFWYTGKLLFANAVFLVQ